MTDGWNAPGGEPLPGAPQPETQQAPVGAYGAPPAGWYPDPSGVPVRRWWDGTQWTGAVDRVAAYDTWEPLGTLARWTAALIGLAGFGYLLLFAAMNRRVEVIDGFGGAYSIIEAEASDRQVVRAFGLLSVALLAAGVVFLVWFNRAYRNASMFRRMRHPGWAVWGWIVPIVSLFRPKQLVNDVWLAGDERADVHTTPKGVSPLVQLWWIAWLATSVLLVFMRLAANGARRETDTLGALRDAAGIAKVASITGLVAAVLAILWVLQASKRLEARHNARMLPPSTGTTQPVT